MLGCLLGVGAGCSAEAPPELEGQWRAVAAPEQPDLPRSGLEESMVSFDGRRWRGFDGCYEGHGSYRTNGDGFAAWQTGNVLSIKCMLGVRYAEWLPKSDRVAFVGDRVNFFAGDTLLLVLEKDD